MSVYDDLTNGLKTALTFQQQHDAVVSQVNPVSDTLYEWKDNAGNPLGTQSNVRIISIAAIVTWLVTQPTNLRVILTLDGIPITYTSATPISTSIYTVGTQGSSFSEANQTLLAGDTSHYRSFLREARTVKVEVAVTWGVTQPTPLELRVKWAKR